MQAQYVELLDYMVLDTMTSKPSVLFSPGDLEKMPKPAILLKFNVNAIAICFGIHRSKFSVAFKYQGKMYRRSCSVCKKTVSSLTRGCIEIRVNRIQTDEFIPRIISYLGPQTISLLYPQCGNLPKIFAINNDFTEISFHNRVDKVIKIVYHGAELVCVVWRLGDVIARAIITGPITTLTSNASGQFRAFNRGATAEFSNLNRIKHYSPMLYLRK